MPPAEPPLSRLFGTFGIYRYVLACMVIMTHTGPHAYARLGNYAVFGFYILSGYVMSFILHNHYLKQSDGLRKYAINRFLRIFPIYWAVMLASLFLVLAFPGQSNDMVPFYNLPEDPRDWIWNIITIGMSDPLTGALNQFALVPGSWSLGIEILFWAMIPTLLQNEKARRRLTIFAIVYTLLAALLCMYSGSLVKPVQYFNAFAAALPFTTGVWLFLRKVRGRPPLPKALGVAAILILPALMWTAPFFYSDPYAIGFYGAFLINMALVTFLSQVDSSRLPQFIARLDEMLGNIAYPMYLVQVPTAFVLYLLEPSLGIRDYPIFFATLIASTLLSWLLYRLVDVRINAFRRRIKGI